jgi:C4-dicarboxylate-specific signal transduction histidine kinase
MADKHMVPSDSCGKSIAFFGRIMANVSHEFNNVITVISELAGLLKDLSLMAQKGREIPPEKLASISDNISRQVARGKNLTTHMNRFSHSADEPAAKADLAQVLENLQVLTDRLFKCRQTGFSYVPPEQDCTLTTNPFELRHVLFSCMDCFLEASSPGISLSLSRREEGGELELALSGKMEAAGGHIEERIEELRRQAAAVEGRLLYEENEDGALIRLVFPAAESPAEP